MSNSKNFRTDLDFRTIDYVVIDSVEDAENVLSALHASARFAQGNLSAREQAHVGHDIAIAQAELAVQRRFAAGDMFVAVGTIEVAR